VFFTNGFGVVFSKAKSSISPFDLDATGTCDIFRGAIAIGCSIPTVLVAYLSVNAYVYSTEFFK